MGAKRSQHDPQLLHRLQNYAKQAGTKGNKFSVSQLLPVLEVLPFSISAAFNNKDLLLAQGICRFLASATKKITAADVQAVIESVDEYGTDLLTLLIGWLPSSKLSADLVSFNIWNSICRTLQHVSVHRATWQLPNAGWERKICKAVADKVWWLSVHEYEYSTPAFRLLQTLFCLTLGWTQLQSELCALPDINQHPPAGALPALATVLLLQHHGRWWVPRQASNHGAVYRTALQPLKHCREEVVALAASAWVDILQRGPWDPKPKPPPELLCKQFSSACKPLDENGWRVLSDALGRHSELKPETLLQLLHVVKFGLSSGKATDRPSDVGLLQGTLTAPTMHAEGDRLLGSLLAIAIYIKDTEGETSELLPVAIAVSEVLWELNYQQNIKAASKQLASYSATKQLLTLVPSGNQTIQQKIEQASRISAAVLLLLSTLLVKFNHYRCKHAEVPDAWEVEAVACIFCATLASDDVPTNIKKRIIQPWIHMLNNGLSPVKQTALCTPRVWQPLIQMQSHELLKQALQWMNMGPYGLWLVRHVLSGKVTLLDESGGLLFPAIMPLLGYTMGQKMEDFFQRDTHISTASVNKDTVFAVLALHEASERQLENAWPGSDPSSQSSTEKRLEQQALKDPAVLDAHLQNSRRQLQTILQNSDTYQHWLQQCCLPPNQRNPLVAASLSLLHAVRTYACDNRMPTDTEAPALRTVDDNSEAGVMTVRVNGDVFIQLPANMVQNSIVLQQLQSQMGTAIEVPLAAPRQLKPDAMVAAVRLARQHYSYREQPLLLDLLQDNCISKRSRQARKLLHLAHLADYLQDDTLLASAAKSIGELLRLHPSCVFKAVQQVLDDGCLLPSTLTPALAPYMARLAADVPRLVAAGRLPAMPEVLAEMLVKELLTVPSHWVRTEAHVQ